MVLSRDLGRRTEGATKRMVLQKSQSSNTLSPYANTLTLGIQWMTIIIAAMPHYPLKNHGEQNGGLIVCLHSCLQLLKLTLTLHTHGFVTTLLTVILYHQLHSGKKLAFDMMENTLDNSGMVEESPSRSKRATQSVIIGHRIMSIPSFCGQWVNGAWTKVATQYLQKTCKCGNLTRYYCECNRAVYYCIQCYAVHFKTAS